MGMLRGVLVGIVLLSLTAALPVWAKPPCVTALFGPDKQAFCLEIADDFESRKTGLQNRSHLASRGGMIFVFPENAPRVFWMRDTSLELDIFFLDDAKKIQSFISRVPPGAISIYASARYVIELPGGTAESLDLWPGNTVQFRDNLFNLPPLKK